MAEKKEKVRKKGRLFWKIFAVWLLVLAAGCITLLVIGVNVMNDYESSQSLPYNETLKIAKVFESGDYSMLFDGENLQNSMTFEKEEFENRITDAIKENGGCTVRKGFSADSVENPTFIISAGEKKIATVVFRRLDQKTRFGFDRYAFESITPFAEGSYSIRLMVPENCELFVDGKLIGAEYRVGEADAFTPAADDIYNAGEVKMYFYRIDGLMNEPTYRIVYKDTGKDAEIRWDDKNEAFTIRTYETEVTAPSDYKVTVGGVEISADGRFVASVKPLEEIDYVREYSPEDTSIVSYHVSGIRRKEDVAVTVLDFEGNDVTPAFSEEEQAYVCGAGITPKDLSVYGIDEEFLFTRAIGYAKFVNNDDPNGRGSDIKFIKSSIKQYFLPDSRAYNDLIDFWVTFTSHKEYWIEDKTVDEITFFNEGLFRARVSFTYWIRGFNHQDNNEKEYPTTVSFWYANVNGTWYIVGMSL